MFQGTQRKLEIDFVRALYFLYTIVYERKLSTVCHCCCVFFLHTKDFKVPQGLLLFNAYESFHYKSKTQVETENISRSR